MSRRLHSPVVARRPLHVTIALLLVVVGLNAARANPGDPLYWVHASDGFEGDGFGWSTAVSGSIALVGSPADSNYPPYKNGAAYLLDATTGQQLFKLTPTDTTPGDRFGRSVAINGNLALVGADRFRQDVDPGSAYVFDVATGQQLTKLKASDGYTGNLFGSAVALSDNRAIVGAVSGGRYFSCCYTVGAAGAAYIFDVTTGQQLFKLTASDPGPHDNFGSSVAVSGDKVIVGAWGNLQQGVHGAAYVFDLNTGQQLFKLTAPPHPGDSFDLDFGYSVAINGNLALVGALNGLDDDSYDRTGSAHLFDLTTGQQLRKFKTTGLAQGDEFGRSVALNNNFALVGAGVGDKAFLFDLTTGNQIAKLGYPGCCFGEFGSPVALNDKAAFVSSPFFDPGRVFAFSTVPEPSTIALAALSLALLLTLPVRPRSKPSRP